MPARSYKISSFTEPPSHNTFQNHYFITLYKPLHSNTMNAYINYPRFYVSVDCVIFGFEDSKLKVLIHKRPYAPQRGTLSLIGGFVEEGESVDQAAKRILSKFTGLDNVYMQQIATFGEVKRDKGERVISIVYYALINVGDYNQNLSKRYKTKWIAVDKLPQLCFDHNEMVKKARQAVSNIIKSEPIGRNLLPKYFSLTLLQSLYESVLGTTMDKRNFRRSITEKDFIKSTGQIEKSNRRGAVLYEYIAEKALDDAITGRALN